MKMLRCSSSLDKNAVLMSLDTSLQLFDARHSEIKASVCAESVDPSRETSARFGSCNTKTRRRALALQVGLHVNTIELSSLDLRQQLSCSQRKKFCDPAATATLPLLICARVSCPHPSSSSRLLQLGSCLHPLRRRSTTHPSSFHSSRSPAQSIFQ